MFFSDFTRVFDGVMHVAMSLPWLRDHLLVVLQGEHDALVAQHLRVVRLRQLVHRRHVLHTQVLAGQRKEGRRNTSVYLQHW